MRTFIDRHRWLAFGLVLAALAMKVLVPGGYMIAASAKVITVQLCDDTGGVHPTAQLAIPMKPGSLRPDHSRDACPYSSLAHPSLGSADPLLLALALAFILTQGFLALAPPRLRGIAYLRPPMRGPPAFA